MTEGIEDAGLADKIEVDWKSGVRLDHAPTYSILTGAATIADSNGWTAAAMRLRAKAAALRAKGGTDAG